MGLSFAGGGVEVAHTGFQRHHHKRLYLIPSYSIVSPTSPVVHASESPALNPKP